jgi:hypothetical protein
LLCQRIANQNTLQKTIVAGAAQSRLPPPKSVLRQIATAQPVQPGQIEPLKLQGIKISDVESVKRKSGTRRTNTHVVISKGLSGVDNQR